MSTIIYLNVFIILSGCYLTQFTINAKACNTTDSITGLQSYTEPNIWSCDSGGTFPNEPADVARFESCFTGIQPIPELDNIVVFNGASFAEFYISVPSPCTGLQTNTAQISGSQFTIIDTILISDLGSELRLQETGVLVATKNTTITAQDSSKISVRDSSSISNSLSTNTIFMNLFSSSSLALSDSSSLNYVQLRATSSTSIHDIPSSSYSSTSPGLIIQDSVILLEDGSFFTFESDIKLSSTQVIVSSPSDILTLAVGSSFSLDSSAASRTSNVQSLILEDSSIDLQQLATLSLNGTAVSCSSSSSSACLITSSTSTISSLISLSSSASISGTSISNVGRLEVTGSAHLNMTAITVDVAEVFVSKDSILSDPSLNSNTINISSKVGGSGRISIPIEFTSDGEIDLTESSGLVIDSCTFPSSSTGSIQIIVSESVETLSNNLASSLLTLSSSPSLASATQSSISVSITIEDIIEWIEDENSSYTRPSTSFTFPLFSMNNLEELEELWSQITLPETLPFLPPLLSERGIELGFGHDLDQNNVRIQTTVTISETSIVCFGGFCAAPSIVIVSLVGGVLGIIILGIIVNSIFFSKPAVKPILGNGGAERKGVFRSMSSPPPPSSSLKRTGNPLHESGKQQGENVLYEGASVSNEGNPLHESGKQQGENVLYEGASVSNEGNPLHESGKQQGENVLHQ